MTDPSGPSPHVWPAVTIIVPFSRWHRADAVLRAISRQRYNGPCRAVIVENGPTVGMMRIKEGPVTVIRSERGHAAAMNAGLQWLRRNGGGSWARFDDDDYYGPDYLTSQMGILHTQRADVVGKPWSYVMFPDGLWRLDSSDREHRLDTEIGLTGGSLCARSAYDLPHFEDRTDDDLHWCRTVRERYKKRTHAAGRHHYCYDRSSPGDRVWSPGGRDAVLRCLSPGRAAYYYGDVGPEAVDDVGLRPLRAVPPPSDAAVLEAM